MREIFPIPVEILENPVVAALENINFGAHPLFTILNMGLLENFEGGYNFYRAAVHHPLQKWRMLWIGND